MYVVGLIVKKKKKDKNGVSLAKLTPKT